MCTMKARILLCITLFVTAASAARPIVDEQQKDSAQVQPDWLGFHRGPFIPRWLWLILWRGHHHFSPAPHSAPHKHTKWPFPHPPFPHFPVPKKPPTTSLASAADTTNLDSSNNVDPDFLVAPWYWYWLWQLLHRGGAHHSSPSPHSAPHKKPSPPHAQPFPFPIGSLPVTHPRNPKTPPGPNFRLEDVPNVDVEAAERCWSPLAAVDNCVSDIISAFTSGIVEFNSACCSAINKMEDECVAGFNNQKFTDALNNYCSTH